MKSWELTKKKTDTRHQAVLRGDWHAGWMEVAAPLQQISTTTDGFPRRRSRSESPPPLQWQGRFSSTYLIQHHQENEKKQKPPYHAKGQPPAIFFCSCLFGSRSEIRPPAAGRLSSKRFPHLIWSNTYHQKSEKEQKPPYAEETEWLSSFFPDPIYRKQNTFY